MKRPIVVALFWLCLISLSTISFGQKTFVEGYVFEDTTARSVTFAKVYFMGTQVGTTTDTAGYFKLDISKKLLQYDTIIVSCLGYDIKKIPINRGESQQIEVQLHSSLFIEIGEVTAQAGENPAWKFMRKLIENKDQNNPENLESYSSIEYSKIRFDLNHFTDEIKKNIILRPFDYIWENTQTTDDGITYLPVLLTEMAVEHNYQNSPRDKKDIVLGEKTTGLAGPNLMEFTNDLYLTPNIYDNYVTILGKSFPSPLNDNYKMNYSFYLMDSTWTDTTKTYKIRFRPKHKRELGFTGEMYFDSESYAITEINLRFDVKANVNFVRSYYISQKYALLDGEHWLLKESNVIGDFTVLENSSDLTGFFGRKRALFYDYHVNTPIDEDKLKGIEIVKYQDSARVRTDAFWEAQRQEEFSQEEVTLFSVTERVLNDPAFKFRKNLFLSVFTGYIPLKGLQVGNIYTFYSYNTIEKSRVKLALRTNPNNAFPWHFSAYGAYGFGDKQWKYGLSSFYNITKKGTTQIGASYSSDIEQLGRSYSQISLDHFVSSLAQLGNENARNYVTKFEGYFEKSIVSGMTTRLTYFNRSYAPTSDSVYLEVINGQTSLNSLYRSAGVSATFKFSYLNSEVTGLFYDEDDLYSSFSKFPELALTYEYADKAVFGSQFDYQKVKLSIRQKVDAKKAGFLTYNIEGGKTFGTVPHVLLDIPFGNQMLLTDEYAFNLMRYMEFAADEYLAVHLTHHFNGLLLDRIPLVNRLKWRTFVFAKAYYGSLSAANNESRYLLPDGVSAMAKPYYEVGFGFENIFKVAAIDFTWRLTPGQGDDIYYFLVKPSFRFSF